MENSKNQIKEGKGSSSKIDSKKDSINIENLKINLSKGKNNLLDKIESSNQRKSLYNGMDQMGSEDQKKFRSKIRRELRRYINSILGKDRKEEERIKSIKSFMKFYKENWKIQDFKIENFSHSKNESDRKDITNLLDYLKSIME